MNCFVWNHKYFEESIYVEEEEKNQAGGGGAEYLTIPIGLCMYIAPSGDHSLPTLNVPFKVILWRFEVVFGRLEWKYCSFQKIKCKFIKIPQYYTMALKQWNILVHVGH